MHNIATFQGLNKWTEHLFTHLGWMILACEDGLDYKVTTYKKSIVHLRKCIEEKWSKINDPDRKDDLKILLDRVKILELYINKIFKK